MIRNKLCAFLAASLLFLSACQKPPQSHSYLFLGHCYQWIGSGDRVDPRVAALPLAQYDQIWLGGDVCAKTTLQPEILQYLDSLFQFQRRNVHWTWGNHDVQYGHEDWIQATTGHPDFYAQWVDGILLVVLNTNLFQWPNACPPADFCRRMEAQYTMLQTLADTVSAASHVVMLHHYDLLTNELTQGEFDLDTVFNYYKPFLKVQCQPDTATFEKAIYPLLMQIRKKGIEVILVGGDLGQRAKSFEFQTADRIWFLGSGINNSADPARAPAYVTNFEPDQVLVFEHDPVARTLEWKFILLSGKVEK
ncbi:MAG: metallophosphoesterase [Saprospirales bacterium]|nr:metallophosphoesterase [Saprospirales bacterium]